MLHFRILGIRTAVLSIITFRTRAKPKERRTMGNSNAKPNTGRPVDTTRAKPKEQGTIGNFNAKPNTGRPTDTTRKPIDSYKQQVLNHSRGPGIIYGPNVDVDDLYIDVVIHTGRAQHKFSKEMERHETYDVYMKVPETSIRLEKIKDLFYPNEDTKGKFPRSILAIGRPGIGKTVLTEKLIRDWANNNVDVYFSDKIVFFFKLRWLNENSNKLTNISLKTFLQFGAGLSEENFESIYEEIAKEPQKAILIFDGLDGYHGDPTSCLDQYRIIPNDPNTGTSAMNLFIELVLGDLLKGATVLVTSRPTADDFYSRLNFDRNVEIIGFTSDKIEEYVSRFCDNHNTSDLEKKIWNHIKSSSELLYLCYIPVNCFIVCTILSGCLSGPENRTGALPTLTELYQTTVHHFEKYYHRNTDINPMTEEALKKLQRLAFFGMESGQLVFGQELFDEQMKTSGLLNSLSNPIFLKQFCFIHLTIQEFLAARHVIETFAPPEIKKFISDHGKSSKWHLVIQFIAGLLGKKINNFDREYKDCVFSFAESFEVTNGKIEVKYHEMFIMKCLREADDEEITKEVCEETAINDVAELYINPASYHLSTSEWAAVTFVCKHMKKLANLTLLEFAADCLPEVLGLLRKRCLNKLEMRAEAHGAVADEIDQVFMALMELHCTLDHKHNNLTSLTFVNFRMTETGLQIMCKFFENGNASQLERLTLNLTGIHSHEFSKFCEVLNNRHCPNLTHLNLGNNSIRDEGARVLCDTLTKGLRKLNRLDVRECKLTDQCIPIVVFALQDERCQLTDLSLGFNAIGDEGACMLFEDALTKEHCELTVLDLRDCSLTDQCIPSLCKALQDERCKLTKLWLWSNYFSENGKRLLHDAKDVRCGFTNCDLVFEPMGQDAVDENYDTDTIKTSNTSDDAHLQDETVDNVEQTDIENRSIYDDRIASAEQLLILGISHETEGRNEEAIKSYEQAVQQAVQIADETDRNDIISKSYQHLGNVFTGMSEYKKAIEYYQKAREISPDLEGNEIEVEAYQWLAYNHIRAGQYQESIKYYNEVVELASELGDKSKKIDAYLGLGSAFSYTKEFESSQEYLRRAIAVAIQLKDKVLQKEAYTNLGAVYYKNCKFDAAVKSYLKVKDISHDLDKTKEEVNACLMLGDIFQELKKHDKAIESYQETLNICEKLEDKEMQIVAIQRLGKLYVTLASVCCKDGDYEKAIRWYENALNIFGKDPNDHSLLYEKALTGLRATWFSLGDTETKAMESIQKAQKFTQDTNTESPESWKWEENSIIHREKFIKLHEYGQEHREEIKDINGVRVCCSKQFCIGKGSGATQVYIGLGKDGYERAVKRLFRDDCEDLAEQEKNVLNEHNTTESNYVVKYWFFDDESDKDWLFLIMDLCEETLKEYVELSSLDDLATNGQTIIRQVLTGLADLHRDPKPILHRDLKPSNILRNVNNKWLLADFGISRIMTQDVSTFRSEERGTQHWKAVESCSTNNISGDDVRYKKKSDIQVAGMVAFYIVTKGEHPFGEEPDRHRNLLDGNPVYLDKLKKDPAAKDLISWMLSHDPKDRPSAQEALKHPYLQSKKQQFEMLCKVGNQQEIKKGDSKSDVVRQLNSDPKDWRSLMNGDVLKYLSTDPLKGYTFRYKPSWTDCLRLIRNVKEHWQDRPRPRPELFYSVGDPQEYFLNLFPNLPVVVHEIIRSCDWKERSDLQEYFS